MFWPYALNAHLTWLAAVILTGVLVSSGLITPAQPSGQGQERAGARA